MSKANTGTGENTPGSWNSPLLSIQNSPTAGSSGSLQDSTALGSDEEKGAVGWRCAAKAAACLLKVAALEGLITISAFKKNKLLFYFN